MDHIKSVAGLGLGSRLKRLSDMYMGEVKLLYAEKGYDFEPKWFPLFSLLSQGEEVTVTAAARSLKLTHPHISLLAKELIKAKLVTSKASPEDARSRNLKLTGKGRKLAQEFQPLWADIQKAVHEVVAEVDPNFFQSLERMETLLQEKPFSARVRALKREKKNCLILDYRPALRPHFSRLNLEWIKRHFEIEAHDEKVFGDPENEILEKGGEIIFAELEGQIVGTCALMHQGGVFELAKLAVSDEAKGHGVGELLCREIIRRALAKGATSLQLTTNTVLVPAIQLYRKLGFEEVQRGQHPTYKRVNLVMRKKLP